MFHVKHQGAQLNELADNDTIIALSSGHGRAGVSVFRISGPKADEFLTSWTSGKPPDFRKAAVRWIIDADGHRMDQALVLRFAAPHSFTGENLVELHCHGSLAVAELVLTLALRLEGFRLADPGEFTRRAFEAGKLDLIQAEGISDIIDATTPSQLSQAARFVAGDASEVLSDWRKSILEASAYLAASIDFSDEGDVGENAHAPVLSILSDLKTKFLAALISQKSASRIRDGIRIAILGEPNAGKSTLMNAFAERDAAIVSDIAGTTRDILEVPMVLSGIPVVLADTAGLRESSDPIEREGVRRARLWAEQADIRILLVPTDQTPPDIGQSVDLVVGTKADLELDSGSQFDLKVSAKSGEGLTQLRSTLEKIVLSLTSTQDAPSIVRLRHQTQMEAALEAIDRAISQITGFDDVDLAAFELSLARSALDQILGRVDVEDILGEVFSGFCVGK